MPRYTIIKRRPGGEVFNVPAFDTEDLWKHIKAVVEITPEYEIIAVINLGE